MNRRTFLIGGAAAVAGCARPAAPPTPALATPQLTDADRDRIAAELAERERHLKLLEGFRVAPNAARTTPPPPADVLAFAPELKPLVKVALRLHPRFGEELPAEATKLGGKFRWPRSEPWPQCEEHRIPFVPVLQLRAEDAPPQFAFRERSDLLQLLWCPRDHGNATRSTAAASMSALSRAAAMASAGKAALCRTRSSRSCDAAKATAPSTRSTAAAS